MKKILFVLMLLCIASNGFALPGVKTQNMQATWTANTETDLNGYYLYWRTNTGQFSDANRIACAKTATSQILTGLVPPNTIIALTAFDVAGNESGFSNEVPFVVDGTAPSSPQSLKIVAVP
jgi:hypothetical protein